MAKRDKTEAEIIRRDARQALAFSRAARKVGAAKIADINRRDAAELNAAARAAKKAGR